MAQNLKFVYALIIMIIVLSSFLAESNWSQRNDITKIHCIKNADCPKHMCIRPQKPKCFDSWYMSQNQNQGNVRVMRRTKKNRL
ncbi:putative Late nodulin [Medicago truncatula]|uniref:Nodule Cysteine-Rich (NCR) secreted peptide n=1 Tax=Medicago truncatula TaxID=3880 RepID=A0A072TGW4_MEDTR|nr:Nodule Cysteine-Rich (NCR) secreted peptide [Medicago truncatula]RHN40764.1 putative Late nodulin [Medicago truncatula]